MISPGTTVRLIKESFEEHQVENLKKYLIPNWDDGDVFVEVVSPFLSAEEAYNVKLENGRKTAFFAKRFHSLDNQDARPGQVKSRHPLTKIFL